MQTRRTKFGIEDTSDEEREEKGRKKPRGRFHAAAKRLVRYHTKRDKKGLKLRRESPPIRSGQVTPTYERDPHNYVARPSKYREGFLSSILRLYNEQGVGYALAHIPSVYEGHSNDRGGSAAHSLLGSTATTPGQTPAVSPETSGTTTPRTGDASPKTKHQKWYYKNQHSRSTGSVSDLVSSSTMFAQPAATKTAETPTIRPKPKHRPRSSQALDAVFGKKKKGPRLEDSLRIQVHIAETMQRQGFLIKMCRALMLYGAPTHRLEGSQPRKGMIAMLISSRVHENVCSCPGD